MTARAAGRAAAAVGWLSTAALAAAMLACTMGLISPATLDHVGLASLGWAAYRLARIRGSGTGRAAAAALALAGGLALARHGYPELHLMPYLLIVPANLAIAGLFAGGLLPGREPILLRLVEAMGVCPAQDPGFRRFIARQCALWAALCCATACLASAAMVASAARPWIDQALVSLFAVQIVWFVLSHHYASIRYGRPEGWWTTARAMMRPDIWARLRTT